MSTTATRPFRPGSDEEKLFLAAVRMVPKHYRSFDMGCVMEETECGTICCFAGIVGLLSGLDLTGYWDCWAEPAANALGLNGAQAARLFHPWDWPDKFYRHIVRSASCTPEYAAVAHERFMHFHRTGE